MTIRDKKYFLSNLKPLNNVHAPWDSLISGREELRILGVTSEIKQNEFYLEFGWVRGMPVSDPRPSDYVNNFDEYIIHLGGDYRNEEDLGAEIEYVLNGQRLTLNTTSGLFVPRGTRQGPVTWKSFRRPHVRIVLIVGSGNPGDIWSLLNSSQGNANPGNANPPKPPAGFNPENYLVRQPAYEVVGVTPIKNRGGPKGPSMTLMSDSLVPGSHIYIEGGWVLGMPDPNPHIFEHSHNYKEIVVHFGNDFNNPEALGGEIDFYMAGLPLKCDHTSVAYVPPELKHGPLLWKNYRAPHLEMAILPGAGTLDAADPGGHREKMRRRGNRHD